MKYAAIIVTIIFISGCAAVPQQWVATGGSKADATVQLGYQYGGWTNAVHDDQQGLDVANLRCQAWGYSGSEPFGVVTKRCVQSDGLGGCSTWRMSSNYQCID